MKVFILNHLPGRRTTRPTTLRGDVVVSIDADLSEVVKPLLHQFRAGPPLLRLQNERFDIHRMIAKFLPLSTM
ncbi:hypothetical protein B4Q13_20290 [Lacticaseibacillus rhamnosus]